MSFIAPDAADPTAYIMAVLFCATFIRSALGFGEALIAVPLLAMRVPLGIAAPLAVMASITIAGVIVIQDWRHVQVRTAGWLLAPTVFGIPLGLMLLTSPHQSLVKLLLAVVIVGFSLYSLAGSGTPELKQDSKPWLLACGFFAGVLGGAYGMNGPPLAVYGTMRRWPPRHFRATLQGYFLPASLLGMAGYFREGLWGRALIHDYLWCVPVILPAIWLGRIANHRLPHNAFRRYVFCGLIGIGLILAFQAISGKSRIDPPSRNVGHEAAARGE